MVDLLMPGKCSPGKIPFHNTETMLPSVRSFIVTKFEFGFIFNMLKNNFVL